MANTPYFSWSTPDDSAYVKDGAAAIRSLANQIDNALQTYSSILLSSAIPFASSTGQIPFTFAANTAVTVGVSYPVGRFTVAPRTFFYTGAVSSAAGQFVASTNSTTTSVLTVTLYAPTTSTGTRTIDYHSVQQLATNALG